MQVWVFLIIRCVIYLNLVCINGLCIEYQDVNVHFVPVFEYDWGPNSVIMCFKREGVHQHGLASQHERHQEIFPLLVFIFSHFYHKYT